MTHEARAIIKALSNDIYVSPFAYTSRAWRIVQRYYRRKVSKIQILRL